ncbi:hypothetical protein JRQ81_018391 [Phrynocephalus forsythii]|uniref:PPIase cyclophilin-type domain-containing protein n=1 Tax=Phrynocephalus forsythii TaxID=171643 RepID=A0A9Q0XPG3_9SAUR|nr:hypothetical protein JRQ81_018391 [Phrynocephalus forsythii]
MIQGGDFSEGNGKGGESIYGGYFKDENFILKHDRAFLLSMANRGKHTNGSQFFITTKPAPHLDGVHVVFGLVISGFEVIEQIENLKTDTASRPYADVRVIDCGVLVTKSAKDALEKKRRVSTHSEASDSSTSSSSTSSESSSESESENERSRRRKRKRRTKIKQSRKRRREERKEEETKNKRVNSERNEANEKTVDLNGKRDKPVVRPEEIPPVPENRFLLRRDAPTTNAEPETKPLDVAPVLTDQKPSVSKSGRKIRGRGTIRYHTPPHSRSCSESDNEGSSETPPHWKEEMQRLRAYRPPSGEKWSKGDKSRSKSRSSSASKPLKMVPTSPKKVTTPLNECKPVKVEPVRTALPQNDKVVIQPVVTESIPVIPLSDSPPPSRWKPGQKPWKPSYERIQEMKAKTTHVIPAQTAYVVETVQATGSTSSYHKRQKSPDSGRSDDSKKWSDRSSRSWRRSRSRSYSKSSSRSRSPSSSRSRSTVRSRSRNKYPSDRSCYSGSSSYFSLSEDDRQKSKTKSDYKEKHADLSKKRQSSSESTLPYAKDTASQRPRESTSRSSSVFSTDSEPPAKPQPAQAKEQARPENVIGNEEKPLSEQGSERSRKRNLREKPESPKSVRKARRKTRAGSKWDSESHSERGGSRNSEEESRLPSSKEEGEATSDSDADPELVKGKAQLDSISGVLKAGEQSSLSETESSRSHSGARGKPRKQKHGSKRSLKKGRSKKSKEKSKGKKEKKQKVPKQKETFHWQPPLEFGEEEEEEEGPAVKAEAKEDGKKQAAAEVKDKNQDQKVEGGKVVQEKARDDGKLHKQKAVSEKAAAPASPADQRSKDDVRPSSSAHDPKLDKNVGTSESFGAAEAENDSEGEVNQMDDMDICTPDHNSPVKADVELTPVSVKVNVQEIKINKNTKVHNTSEMEHAKPGNEIKEGTEAKESSREKERTQPPTIAAAVEGVLKSETAGHAQGSAVDHKWKPLQGVGNLHVAATAGPSSAVDSRNPASSSESKAPGLRIEIKSKNKIRPGSLFDEVRKTARLNRRPRNRESSSEEDSPTPENSPSRSCTRSRSKSEPKSRHRTRSISYSRSRSHSRSSTYSYRSRSYTRSRSRGWYSRGRSRSRSSSYNSGRSHSRTYSRSRSRSSSYDHRSRSSRSYTYDSYYSRSRSRSRSQRSDSYRRSRSYNRRSRSYGSDSESDRSYSNNRSPSESSRYS